MTGSRPRATPAALVPTLALALVMAGDAAADAPPPLDHLVATRERPLFAPSRRPPPAPPAAEAGSVDPPGPARVPEPAAVLTGIIVGDAVRLAVFRNADGRAMTLREGDGLEGWTLVAVEARAVRLARDGAADLERRLPEPVVP